MRWIDEVRAADPSGRVALVIEALRSRRIAEWAAEPPATTEAWLTELEAATSIRMADKIRQAIRRERGGGMRLAPPQAQAPPPRPMESGYPEPAVLLQLQRSKPKGDEGPKLKPSAWNLGTILREDSRWKGRFRLNTLREEEEMRDAVTGRWRAPRDVDDVNAGRWVSDVYGLEYGSATVGEQVSSIAHEHKHHPVVDYLARLKPAEGVCLIDEWLTDAFGAERSDLATEIGRAWLVSMVARVRQPGCKVDTVPVLIGDQGVGKSSSLRALMADPAWFADSEIPLRSTGPDRYQVLQGIWLYEVAEIDRYSSKIDASEIKAYITSQADTYRASYGRRPRTVPRQVVFAATTNSPEPMVDPTGSRRFWPIQCGDCNPDWVTEHRDQLWAEAVALYEAGATWWLSATAGAEVAEIADKYRASHPWEHSVAAWLDEPAQAYTNELTISDVLIDAVGVPVRDHDAGGQRIVGGILGRLGWVKTNKRSGKGGKTGARIWVKAS